MVVAIYAAILRFCSPFSVRVSSEYWSLVGVQWVLFIVTNSFALPIINFVFIFILIFNYGKWKLRLILHFLTGGWNTFWHITERRWTPVRNIFPCWRQSSDLYGLTQEIGSSVVESIKNLSIQLRRLVGKNIFTLDDLRTCFHWRPYG